MIKNTLLFLSMICLMSCVKDVEEEPYSAEQYVKMTIDGNEWKSTTHKASHIDKIVSIEAEVGNTSQVFSIQGVDAKGDYTLGNVSVAVYEIKSGTDIEAYTTSGTLGSGNVNISFLSDTWIEGTFSYKGGNGLGESIEVKEGRLLLELTD